MEVQLDSSFRFHPTLPLDADHYQKCYKAFCGALICCATTSRKSLGTAIDNRLLGVGAILTDKLGRRMEGQQPPIDEPLRHLGVGSGSGRIEGHLLQVLLGTFKQIYSRVLEPSGESIASYQALVQADPSLAEGVEFDWRQQTLEAYQASDDKGRDVKFDVITSMHSIYYGGRMEDKVPYLYNLLTEGGVLLFELKSETDDLSQVQRHFLSPDIPGYRYYTAQKLQSFLDASDIKYDRVDGPRYHIDVTECFDNRSTEGALILDFLSHMRQFRKEVPVERREMFLGLLRQNARPVGDRLMLTHDTSVVTVQRTAGQEFKE
ncbi:histamine N-methyltransferase-like [Patiria miniata]|uniref:Histamine N-methyltransferase n=1 Tax=Patiria miniata TaxID=46514 RepID=A0A914BS19_PATMI|nr:histamine N-methyltransferase-like [Patiria miniata]